ncbi:DUF4193 domain-containing protein [Kitasatospora aureofaciens]|uniref:DUF4193 domain-containing protein n=1 Tax=Kitasatospora aureofaciens TaxID=1894 RepID=UPI001C46BE39|nr:DUF4193 domain-containing protein [Kitasatospora aureofaciens]MBV6703357.1 DUF4193 domain-containing protein [Kitasatospora aureofaciens]
MATDYDAPRNTGDDASDDSIEELKSRRDDKQGSAVDVDTEAAEGLELPGADLSGEELTVQVVPLQQDEFTCMTCFLVHHRVQLAGEDGNGQPICRDCAS